jgi:hypothetical protein
MHPHEVLAGQCEARKEEYLLQEGVKKREGKQKKSERLSATARAPSKYGCLAWTHADLSWCLAWAHANLSCMILMSKHPHRL